MSAGWPGAYFSLLFPDKLDDYHVENYQRFHLIRLLQLPPGDGAIVRRFVAIGRELQMPLNHLTSVLNQRNGRPHKYWRIGTSAGELDFWPLMRDGHCVAIGWSEATDDLSRFSNTEDLVESIKPRFLDSYPNTSKSVATTKANEIKRFANITNNPNYLSAGAWYWLQRSRYWVLGVSLEYQHVPDTKFPHHRPVEWLGLME